MSSFLLFLTTENPAFSSSFHPIRKTFFNIARHLPKGEIKAKEILRFFLSDFKMPFDFVLLPGCLLGYSNIHITFNIHIKKRIYPQG